MDNGYCDDRVLEYASRNRVTGCCVLPEAVFRELQEDGSPDCEEHHHPYSDGEEEQGISLYG